MTVDMHSYQDRYWRELVQLKVQLQYLSCYQAESERIDRSIRVFSAIASSTSIAGWAVWQQAQFVWAGIIVASQLLSAIKEYLPYQRRLKQLSALGADLVETFMYAESKWYLVSEGLLTNREIYELTMELKRRSAKAALKHLKTDSLPPKKKLREQARQQVELYFKVFYERGGQD